MNTYAQPDHKVLRTINSSRYVFSTTLVDGVRVWTVSQMRPQREVIELAFGEFLDGHPQIREGLLLVTVLADLRNWLLEEV